MSRSSSIRRDGTGWIVNDRVQTRMLVGAGGHFCPVARSLNGATSRDRASVVVAQEAEFAIEPSLTHAFRTSPDMPELYFCRDLSGYGWCFRKGQYLNIGFGRLDRRSLPQATAEFVEFLEGDAGRFPRRHRGAGAVTPMRSTTRPIVASSTRA